MNRDILALGPHEGESWPSRDWCGARSLLAQGRQRGTECLLPSTNGDRELGGVGCGALCLHRYSEGDVTPRWRDVVPQNGLPGQKEASWHRIAGIFCWRVSCLAVSVLHCCRRKLCGGRGGSASGGVHWTS